MTDAAAAAFQAFVQEARKIWTSHEDVGARMEHLRPVLKTLVSNEALRAASKSWPSTEGRKNLLLHTDDLGFIVNAVVRVPGRKGNAHDHSQAWVLYGLLDGNEYLERFERTDDGTKPGFATIRLASVTEGHPGSVDLVPPFDIHAEQGGAGRSVAVILRSERLVGRHLQNGYDRETGAVVARPGPVQIPFDVATGQTI